MDYFHYQRIAPPLKAPPLKKNVLLMSPRQTGTTTYLKKLAWVDLYFDLQDPDTFRKLSFQKNFISQLITADMKVIAIDHIHRLPSLFDQIHQINLDHQVYFLLSTTQPLQSHPALDHVPLDTLGLLPFCSKELGFDLNLNDILNFGSLPAVYNKNLTAEQKIMRLNDYVGMLFQSELIQSGKIRKIENFSRFLNVAAEFNGHYLNYQAMAKMCEVPGRTVRQYYELLKSLGLGYEVETCGRQSVIKTRTTKKSKFYFFDLGVVNSLNNDHAVTTDFEKMNLSLKHFILLELVAYKKYIRPELEINIWCDYQGHEIDFIINNELALDIRATKSIHRQHFARLIKAQSNLKLKKSLLISQDEQSDYKRGTDFLNQGLDCVSLQQFLKQLWAGQLF